MKAFGANACCIKTMFAVSINFFIKHKIPKIRTRTQVAIEFKTICISEKKNFEQ